MGRFKPLEGQGGIIFLLVVFSVVATIYSVNTPLFETPDEIQHYFYVKQLADGKGLPHLGLPPEGLWRQEGTQPPLYYALGALATFWVNSDDAEELLWYNPHADIGIPLAEGNKNVIIHTEREAFPYRGAVLAVHLVRLLSVALGAITVGCTYLLSLELFPQRKDLALGAASFNAFIPQFLFLSGAANNDSLVVALSSLALLLVVRLSQRSPSRRGYLALGLTVGLASLAKINGLGLIVLAMSGLLLVAVKRRSLRVMMEGGGIILPLFLLLAGWWYFRNWRLYGDPTALNMHLAITGSRARPLTWRQLLYEWQGFRISFWALFGWFNILAPSLIYHFFNGLTIVGAAGFLVVAIRYLRGERNLTLATLSLLPLWLLVVALTLYSWNFRVQAAQGRLAFPAISAFSFLIFWGLSQWGGQRTGPLVATVGGLLMIAALICPFRSIAPAYARPPLLRSEEVEGIPIDVNFGGQMALLGYRLGEEEVRVGDSLHVTLYWQSIVVMEKDYTVSVKVLGKGGEVMGQEDSYPGLGSYPTSLWKEGEVIGDTYGVPIMVRLQAPVEGKTEVSLYDLATGRSLIAYDGRGQPLDKVIIGTVRVVPRRLK